MGKLKEKFVDWTYDPEASYCSRVPDEIWGFDFSHPCYVHDAYYRGHISRRTIRAIQQKDPLAIQDEYPTRKFADQRFRTLMERAVRQQAPIGERRWGFIEARRRYLAVRMFGWRFWNPKGLDKQQFVKDMAYRQSNVGRA